MSLKNIFDSAVATSIAELLTFAICTTKTNYQNSSGKSFYNTARELYRKGGIATFYKGAVPAVLSQILSTSSKYFFYRGLEDQNLRWSNKFLNGAMSGILSSFITHPIDFIKVNIQMGTPAKELIKQIFGFYRGYSKTFGKVCVGSSLFFPLFDYFQNKTRSVMIASFCSAIISTFFTQPFDYLKVRHIHGVELYKGFNPTKYYKGFVLNLTRVIPHFMITMCIVEHLKYLK